MAVAGGVGAAVWGVLIEPRLLQKRLVDAWLPDLPAGWREQRLALLGDLQVGAPLANTDTIRRAVREAIAARPGAVLLTGDYVYNTSHDPPAIIGQLVELLRPLASAGLPTLGVLGNHDFALESTPDPRRQRALADEVEAALEQAGIRILRNLAIPLPAPLGGGSGRDVLYVVGIGERSVDQDNWRAAFARVPEGAARVVLAHDPLALEPIPAGRAPLALAGHTHGGQIRVPSQPGWTPARWWMRWPEYVDGWIDGLLEPGNRLYVNRGIGFSKLPVRLGAPPELTLVTLHGRARAGGTDQSGRHAPSGGRSS
jgi:predicted MPP superfamily phosphohydrolase